MKVEFVDLTRMHNEIRGEINEAIKIAITIPRVSNQSKSWNKNNVFMANAINKIFIMGSPRDSKKSFEKLFFFLPIISFVPYFFLFLITSFLLRPFIIFFLLKNFMRKFL